MPIDPEPAGAGLVDQAERPVRRAPRAYDLVQQLEVARDDSGRGRNSATTASSDSYKPNTHTSTRAQMAALPNPRGELGMLSTPPGARRLKPFDKHTAHCAYVNPRKVHLATSSEETCGPRFL